MMPIYTIQQITKRYQNREVLSIDRLEIEQGEFLAIVGPSGAGKSTFLRLLNFLESPSSGKIGYDGTSYQDAAEVTLDVRRAITMVFQRPSLLNRSVAENVAYGLRLRGQRGYQDDVKAMVDKLGLTSLSRQPVRQLSGGEMQRVALARALVIQPRVLLLDEPTANLDPYNVNLFEELVCEYTAQMGMTVVMVTHNIFQAHRLAQRTAFLLEGQLIEVNVTEQIFNHPTDPRTTAFIRGEMVY